MMFQVYRVHRASIPLEGDGVLVTRISKGVYSSADIRDRGSIETAKRLAGKDTEPDFDLVQPRSMGRNVMKIHARVSRQPSVMFGFMGIKVIKYYMQFFVRIKSYGLIHEV